MDQQDKKHKKKSKINSRPIVSLLIGLTFFSVIVIVTLLATSSDSRKYRNGDKNSTQEGEQEDTDLSEPSVDGEMLAVVKEIDTGRKQVTLYGVERKETATLSYNGGTNITDKYGQIISISQIPIGAMVDVWYQQDKNKLTDMQISTKAWEYIGVSNINIDRTASIMKIATTKYKYSEDVSILDGQDFIPVANLAEQDELTIRGYEETIWSITVTKGHGMIKLEDYENFLGANITVGYEAMQQITEDITITVREGNFNLTIENGQYSAMKNVTIYRNKETYVSLSDLGPEAMKQSRITFEITPFGAELFVDGEITSYANPLELNYGEHTVVVSLGGYTSYQGILNVDVAGKVIKIDLPEAASSEEVVVSETEDTQVENGEDSNTGEEGIEEDPENVSKNEDSIIDEDHLIYVQNPIRASIYLNGEFMGISPKSFPKVIGTHVITFIEEGYQTMSYTIEVLEDGLDTYLNFPDLIRTNTQ